MSAAPVLEMRLPPRPEAVVAARRALDALPEPAAPDARHDLALLVTELVANGVRHGRGAAEDAIGLRVLDEPGRIRVEVRDDGDGFRPRPRRPSERATTGRGLLLLDGLARRWGVERADRACVWFELDWPLRAA